MSSLAKPDNQSEAVTDLNIDLDSASNEPNVPPIAKTGHKSFMIFASFLFFLPHLDIPAGVLLYNMDERRFHDIFLGFKSVGNGYDIFCGVFMILGLVAMSLPFQKIQKLRMPVYGLFVCCHIYISLFLFHLQTRASSDLRFRWLIIMYTVLFSGSFSVFASCLIYSDKPNPGIGIGISVVIGFIFVNLFRYIKPNFTFRLYEYLVYILINTIYAWIVNQGAHNMVTFRQNLYTKNDPILATGHFFTDIFFGFWKDLIFKPKPTLAINDLTIDQNGDIISRPIDL